MSTIVTYRNEPHQKYCQVALDNGEQVTLRLDPSGMTIELLAGSSGPGAVLFHADAERATSIVKSLAEEGASDPARVLDLLLAAIMELGSAAKIKAGFAAAFRAVGAPAPKGRPRPG